MNLAHRILIGLLVWLWTLRVSYRIRIRKDRRPWTGIPDFVVKVWAGRWLKARWSPRDSKFATNSMSVALGFFALRELTERRCLEKLRKIFG